MTRGYGATISTALAAAVTLMFLAADALAAWPYPEDAPWPAMRGDLRNSGLARSLDYDPAPGAPAEPVYFRTGNGIFSTPIMDGKDRIYVGSADHYFYALDPASGEVLWRFDGKEIIDSAAALSADGTVYFPGGDARLHALDLQGNEKWYFDVLNDRPEGLYSFSTNYWWESNVVLGPDKNVYAANDDFFLYSLEPDGDLRWAFRTGFLIWSAPAFAEDGTVYIAGFDMKLYAIDPETGKMKWKRNLGNPLVASPAVGPGGVIYQSGFDGRVHAIEPSRGRVLWTAETGGHVYASAAIAPDGLVYVTSTDGMLYAIEEAAGQVRWTYYTGDAVRSSPALGPDPEGKDPYLVYFGGGEGMVYAIEPGGERRWSYDTLADTDWADYPNINACPALGKSGLTVASANGDVVYIPYNYYLKPGARGIVRDPADGFPAEGAHWHWVTPGGLIGREPVAAGGSEVREVHPGQVLNLRAIVRDGGHAVPIGILKKSATLEVSPAADFKIAYQGDGASIHLVPEEMLEPGREYRLQVGAEYRERDGDKGGLSGSFQVRAATPSGGNAMIGDELPAFRVTHMAVPQPPIIPSLNQIGIASLNIPFVVVGRDESKGTFTAWGLQRFGVTEDGEQVGVPDQRTLFYAFSGRTDGDFFELKARNSLFEGTAFPFPLDEFRLSGRIEPDGTAARGASLYAEWEPEGILKGLGLLTISSEEEGGGQQNWVSNTVSGGGAEFFKAANKSLPAVMGYLSRRVWKPWGLYNQEGKFVGSGTFRMHRLDDDFSARPEGVELAGFLYNRAAGRVVVDVDIDPGVDRKLNTIVGILVVDKATGEPLPINYNLATRRQVIGERTKRSTLTLPRAMARGKDLEAYVMVNLHPLERRDLE